MTPDITVDDTASEAGLGPMLADLIRHNLRDHPKRHADFDHLRGKVAIEARDAGVAITMDFLDGHLLVSGGETVRPDLKLAADSLSLLELTNARLRGGLPDPTHASGRRVLKLLLSGRLRIRGRGLLLKPRLLLRLNTLLNVSSA